MTTRRSQTRKTTAAATAKATLCASPTEEALHKSMKDFGRRIAKDPAAARAFLQRAGIVTPTGKLSKAYGG
jgi:hypothetical protein